MKKEFRITIDVAMEEEAALFLGDRLTGMFKDTDLPTLIGDDFTATMTYADGRALFADEEDYYDEDFPEVDDSPIEDTPPILALEADELLVNDIDKGIIKVSNDIFDDFNKDTIIDIEFVDESPKMIHNYKMVSQDEEGIVMTYLGTEPNPDDFVLFNQVFGGQYAKEELQCPSRAESK